MLDEKNFKKSTNELGTGDTFCIRICANASDDKMCMTSINSTHYQHLNKFYLSGILGISNRW